MNSTPPVESIHIIFIRLILFEILFLMKNYFCSFLCDLFIILFYILILISIIVSTLTSMKQLSLLYLTFISFLLRFFVIKIFSSKNSKLFLR